MNEYYSLENVGSQECCKLDYQIESDELPVAKIQEIECHSSWLCYCRANTKTLAGSTLRILCQEVD